MGWWLKFWPFLRLIPLWYSHNDTYYIRNFFTVNVFHDYRLNVECVQFFCQTAKLWLFLLLTVNLVENLRRGGGPVTFIASKGQIVVNQIPNLIYSWVRNDSSFKTFWNSQQVRIFNSVGGQKILKAGLKKGLTTFVNITELRTRNWSSHPRAHTRCSSLATNRVTVVKADH